MEAASARPSLVRQKSFDPTRQSIDKLYRNIYRV